jgi:sugar O-acyltransferase (sialic acid O-acetyltransferase NeuD family)
MTAPQKTKGLVIVGDSAFAEIACEYFSLQSAYEVVGFSVEQAYLKQERLLERPIVPFETLPNHFPPGTHDVYVAITYRQLNRVRARLARAAKEAGYSLAGFVSPHALVWPNATIGEHCFIFENNVVQPFVTLGDNVVLWSGNHVGHHTRVGDNVFVSSHVVISGFCDIGANCFLGVNAAIGNNLSVGKDCWIGPGAVVSTDLGEGRIYRAAKGETAKIGALRFFKVEDRS